MTAIDDLIAAVNYVNENHPLPRCRHGNALRDGGDWALAPSCGCTDAKDREPRVKGMDPDYRRDPKTKLYCTRCQKDIKGKYRLAFVVDDCGNVLHPDDERLAARFKGAHGWQPIGLDCAKKIGLAWTKERP